jgi:hypothetical protein
MVWAILVPLHNHHFWPLWQPELRDGPSATRIPTLVGAVPGAVQIVDPYHARQHLWDIAALLYPHNAAAKKRWMVPMKDLLDQAGRNSSWSGCAKSPPGTPDLDPAWRRRSANRLITSKPTRAGCGTRNFVKKGFFVGSGLTEAGCQSIVGARLKQSGMFWTVRGADAIITLRRCHHNGRFEDYSPRGPHCTTTVPITFMSRTRASSQTKVG